MNTEGVSEMMGLLSLVSACDVVAVSWQLQHVPGVASAREVLLAGCILTWKTPWLFTKGYRGAMLSPTKDKARRGGWASWQEGFRSAFRR